MDFVTDRIAIGHSNDARNFEQLKDEGITAVLNTAFDLDIDYSSEDLDYYKVGLTDGPGNSIYILVSAFYCLKALSKKHKKVLVHCHAGRSRSGIVVSLFLAITQKKSLDAAILEIREERSKVNPHQALRDLAKEVLDNEIARDWTT